MARPADAQQVFDFLKSLSHHEVHPEWLGLADRRPVFYERLRTLLFRTNPIPKWLGHADARQVSDLPDDSQKCRAIYDRRQTIFQ